MNRELVSRLVAAVVLAFALAFLTGAYEHSKLAKMQAMTPQEYYDHAKQLASEPFGFRVASFTIFGVIYVVCVEILTFVFLAGWRGNRRDDRPPQ